MIQEAAQATGLVLSAVVLVHGATWTVLCLVAVPRPRPLRRERTPGMRLAALVPAHNEAETIGRCVRSLKDSAQAAGVELPVVVVADNCADATAEVACGAGGVALERDDALRGKPHALDFGLAWLGEHERPDAVLFVDGDSTVNQDFVGAMAEQLERGASAVQSHYAAGEGESPLNRLRRLALLLVHWSRPLGAARLGLGTGLKGNGMALRWELVQDGFEARGLAEDAERTVDLARRGVAVAFAPRACVRGDMPGDYERARRQDRRWEGGRLRLIPRALSTSVGAVARGRIACGFGAAEVATLPLSMLVMASVAALALAIASGSSPAPALAAGGSLVAYVGAGLVAARAPWRDVAALAWAPRFVLHKALVLGGLALRGRPREWEKTERA